eukprot:1911898-Prymnesium_polylepis.1
MLRLAHTQIALVLAWVVATYSLSPAATGATHRLSRSCSCCRETARAQATVQGVRVKGQPRQGSEFQRGMPQCAKGRRGSGVAAAEGKGCRGS